MSDDEFENPGFDFPSQSIRSDGTVTYFNTLMFQFVKRDGLKGSCTQRIPVDASQAEIRKAVEDMISDIEKAGWVGKT